MKGFVKIMRYSMLAVVIFLSSNFVSGNINQVSAVTKSTSKYQQYYSWVGVKIFKTGVLGWYDSNGKKVTKHNKVSQQHSTGVAWSFSNTQSYWTSTLNTTQAKAYSQAKFVLGISSSSFSIGLQSTTKGITATGKP
ncbi:hypothetical protein ABKP09_06740 [Peribacillus frigoritolerans]|uniref:hypothetical protein n=1 Tax=Peribacillus frigoritolerans TaxID=450367 RepID=UPI0032B45AD8